ncbi:MAG: hypothetical protein HDS53_01840 [Barnesiella sp.]|nr:hypothetical protein [Barnesiella sp.]
MLHPIKITKITCEPTNPNSKFAKTIIIMLNRVVFIAFCILTANALGARVFTLDREHNGLRPGDSMKLRQIEFVDTVSAGEYRIWDLSGLESRRVHRLTISSLSADEDTLSCVVDRTRYIFSVSGDTIKYEGFENNLSDIKADRAENVLIFPIQLNNIFTCEFSGSGRYADHLRQQMKTQCRSCADASGTLITPEGDTIPNVLRLRTVRNIRDRYIPLNVAERENRADSVSLREINSRFYAEGYRYPLLICSSIYSGDDGKLISSKAYSLSSTEMASLDDPVNDEARREISDLAKNGQNPDGRDNGNHSETSKIDYTLRQDKSTATMTIDFTVTENTAVAFVLADIYGIVYSSETHNAAAGESYSVTFDYGKLPYSAAYGINITVGQEVHSEKFYR